MILIFPLDTNRWLASYPLLVKCNLLTGWLNIWNISQWYSQKENIRLRSIWLPSREACHAKPILILTSVEHGKQRSCAGVRSSEGISLLETASLCRCSWWRIERSFGRDKRKPCQICAAARCQDRNKSLGSSADQVRLFFTDHVYRDGSSTTSRDWCVSFLPVLYLPLSLFSNLQLCSLFSENARQKAADKVLLYYTVTVLLLVFIYTCEA